MSAEYTGCSAGSPAPCKLKFPKFLVDGYTDAASLPEPICVFCVHLWQSSLPAGLCGHLRFPTKLARSVRAHPNDHLSEMLSAREATHGVGRVLDVVHRINRRE